MILFVSVGIFLRTMGIFCLGFMPLVALTIGLFAVPLISVTAFGVIAMTEEHFRLVP